MNKAIKLLPSLRQHTPRFTRFGCQRAAFSTGDSSSTSGAYPHPIYIAKSSTLPQKPDHVPISFLSQPASTKTLIGWVKQGSPGQSNVTELSENIKPNRFISNSEFEEILQDVIAKEAYNDIGIQSV
jgi:hypothetical protein